MQGDVAINHVFDGTAEQTAALKKRWAEIDAENRRSFLLFYL